MLFSNIENTLFILIDKNINILIITFTNTLLQGKLYLLILFNWPQLTWTNNEQLFFISYADKGK